MQTVNVEKGKPLNIIFFIVTNMKKLEKKLIHDMFLLSGSMHLSLEVFLTVGADEEVSLTHTCDRVAMLQLEICKFLAGDLVS